MESSFVVALQLIFKIYFSIKILSCLDFIYATKIYITYLPWQDLFSYPTPLSVF